MVDPDPLAWRSLAAQVFAEAERRGLGRFTPQFVAAPGKRLLAQAFVDHRCDELAQSLLDAADPRPPSAPAGSAAARSPA